MNNKRLIASVIELVLGTVLIILGCFAKIDDYWSGMGGGLLAVGILQLIRQIRYKSDVAYQEAMDTKRGDERNRFLGMKAWSWAGYLFVLIAAIGSVVFKLLGEEKLMFAASGSVCLILVLYWVSYLILRKKY